MSINFSKLKSVKMDIKDTIFCNCFPKRTDKSLINKLSIKNKKPPKSFDQGGR
jgi:hypothetical protein